MFDEVSLIKLLIWKYAAYAYLSNFWKNSKLSCCCGDSFERFLRAKAKQGGRIGLGIGGKGWQKKKKIAQLRRAIFFGITFTFQEDKNCVQWYCDFKYPLSQEPILALLLCTDKYIVIFKLFIFLVIKILG